MPYELESELAHEYEVSPCPAPAPITLSGFPRYQNTVGSLSPGEQMKLRQFARMVVGSFRPGCSRVALIRITGHADLDLQRGRAFEARISRERALQTARALARLINNEGVSSRIRWRIGGAGSSRLVVKSLASESDRRRNRRVEISTLRCAQTTAARGFAATGASVCGPQFDNDCYKKCCLEFCRHPSCIMAGCFNENTVCQNRCSSRKDCLSLCEALFQRCLKTSPSRSACEAARSICFGKCPK